MAKQKTVYEVFKELGYEPIEERSILVKYKPQDLSGAIVKFFNFEFYILQLTKDEIVLARISDWGNVKKEITLSIPYSDIKNISIEENGLNYDISISTNEETVELTTQQEGLSDYRYSGMLTGWKNWHSKNLQNTLDDLKKLGK